MMGRVMFWVKMKVFGGNGMKRLDLWKSARVGGR